MMRSHDHQQMQELKMKDLEAHRRVSHIVEPPTIQQSEAASPGMSSAKPEAAVPPNSALNMNDDGWGDFSHADSSPVNETNFSPNLSPVLQRSAVNNDSMLD
jgi:hypothetical protein